MKQSKTKPVHDDDLDQNQVGDTSADEISAPNSDTQSTTELEQKCVELEEKYRRVLADYQNLEHRVQIERTQYMKTANRWLIESLLEPLDFMEKATAHIDDKGLKMVIDRFYQVLESEGLKEIQALGKSFDEKTMEAIDTTEGEDGKVVSVAAKGFMLGDQVLRHARVVVGKKTN